MTAGLPTGVYMPVEVTLPPFPVSRNVVMLSPRWLQTYMNRSFGSMLKLRG
jgi:hypothetical protein